MKCNNCLKRDYCTYIYNFNIDTNVGCIEFQSRDNTTYLSGTLNNWSDDASTADTKISALEIIKNKNIDFKTLKEAFVCNGDNQQQCEMYNANCWEWLFHLQHPGCVNINRDKSAFLTQEEYDTLKKELHDETKTVEVTKTLDAIEALEKLCDLALCGDLEFGKRHNIWTRFAGVEKYKPIIEATLKRNIELEQETKMNRILETVRDNFNLCVEPEYRATLQFVQCCSIPRSEYENFIEYFGEPRDE